ncbi:hypothetical protein BHE74_00058706 [Ensete ventricosum]|nr:hypothetical protein BHE74_00058706 [Ensete ventricosum]
MNRTSIPNRTQYDTVLKYRALCSGEIDSRQSIKGEKGKKKKEEEKKEYLASSSPVCRCRPRVARAPSPPSLAIFLLREENDRGDLLEPLMRSAATNKMSEKLGILRERKRRNLER